MSIQNPFATPEGARRYHSGRPFHHPRALGRIMAVVGGGPFKRGLDVACGTGLSTTALADHADLALGVDPVEAMLHLATGTSNTFFACATAENLPFASKTFDLVTVSSGVHWFDQDAFFDEAARVLLSQGWLAIYDHFFEGSLDEPAIDSWLRNQYGAKYPPPARTAMANKPLNAPTVFVEVEVFEYSDPIPFTHDELTSYLLSHSNTIAPATEGRESPQETERWLRNETAQWFDPPTKRAFQFRGAGRCLRLQS